MPTYGPGTETRKAVVDLLRDDQGLSDLLFPESSPSLGAEDVRVYDALVELPESPQIRTALPRVLVEAIDSEWTTEQDDPATLPAAIVVYVTSAAERTDALLAEAIDARVRSVLASPSTRLSSSRIIAAGLVWAGRVRLREEAFRGAYRVTSTYRSPNVGVLAT